MWEPTAWSDLILITLLFLSEPLVLEFSHILCKAGFVLSFELWA